jgi:phosphatidylinositol alpha 1,6-mannosyltransferase
VVTSGGGPKYIVQDGVTGFVAADERTFFDRVVELAKNPGLLQSMRVRARDYALCKYWRRIFDQVYDAYEYCLRARRASPPVEATSGRG